MSLTAILLGPGWAFAADEEEDEDSLGFYVEYAVGISHVPNQTLRGDGGTGAGLFGSTRQQEVGYLVGFSAGIDLPFNLRVEQAIHYRNAEVRRLSAQGGGNLAVSSNVSLFAIMANLYYDLDFGQDDFPLVPFVGLGIGWGMPEVDAENRSTVAALQIEDKDSVFVYNAMVGASYPLSDVVDFALTYRYVATEDISVSGEVGGVAQRFEYEFDAHEATVGIRVNF